MTAVHVLAALVVFVGIVVIHSGWSENRADRRAERELREPLQRRSW